MIGQCIGSESGLLCKVHIKKSAVNPSVYIKDCDNVETNALSIQLGCEEVSKVELVKKGGSYLLNLDVAIDNKERDEECNKFRIIGE